MWWVAASGKKYAQLTDRYKGQWKHNWKELETTNEAAVTEKSVLVG